MSNCNAIRQGDQMQCGRCSLAWDIDDKDRPKCNPLDMASRAQRDRANWKLSQVRKTHNFKRGW